MSVCHNEGMQLKVAISAGRLTEPFVTARDTLDAPLNYQGLYLKLVPGNWSNVGGNRFEY